MNCNLPGSSVHGILQARILEWVAISFSRGPSQPRDQTPISHISGIDRWILYLWGTWEAFSAIICIFNVFFFFQLHCLFFQVSGGQSLIIGSLYTPVWEMPKVANCGAVRFCSAYEGKGGDLAGFLTSWGSCCIIPLFSWWIPAFSGPGTAGGKGAHLQGWRPPVSRC